MSMLRLFLLGIIILLCVPFERAEAQWSDPYKHILRLEVFESRNDSADLAEKLISQEGDGEISEDHTDEYQGFDNALIHYSPRPDFSKKKDTTILYLANQEHPYVHMHDGIVVSRFGRRGRRNHYGTDLRLRTGDPIYSCFDGVVRIAKRNSTYGNLVVIRHTNGLETYYAHLSKLEVVSEQPVKAGDIIGLGGSTGRSTGPHLHFELRYLGAPINPEDIIDFENKVLKEDTLYLCQHHFRYLKDISAAAQARYHKIKPGETLSGIARKYRTTVANLAKLNRISPNSKIRAGASIRVR